MLMGTRRDFMKKAGLVVGGLVSGLALPNSVSGQNYDGRLGEFVDALIGYYEDDDRNSIGNYLKPLLGDIDFDSSMEFSAKAEEFIGNPLINVNAGKMGDSYSAEVVITTEPVKEVVNTCRGEGEYDVRDVTDVATPHYAYWKSDRWVGDSFCKFGVIFLNIKDAGNIDSIVKDVKLSSYPAGMSVEKARDIVCYRFEHDKRPDWAYRNAQQFVRHFAYRDFLEEGGENALRELLSEDVRDSVLVHEATHAAQTGAGLNIKMSGHQKETEAKISAIRFSERPWIPLSNLFDFDREYYDFHKTSSRDVLGFYSHELSTVPDNGFVIHESGVPFIVGVDANEIHEMTDKFYNAFRETLPE